MFRKFIAVLIVLFLLVDLILAKIPQGPKEGPPPPSKKFLTLSGMSNMRFLLNIVLCRLSS